MATRKAGWLLTFICLMSSVISLTAGGCGRSSGIPERKEAAASNQSHSPTEKSSSPATNQATQIAKPTIEELTADPQSCVAAFLEAIRQGDDRQILQLYTAKAREEATALGEHFAPRGSDTAEFEVGEVQFLDAVSARVKAVWTDINENGRPQSDEAIWMVRKEQGGWRVAAMAVKVFDGDEYLFLDFEDLNRTKLMIEEFRREQIRRAAEMANRSDPLIQNR